jgi:hypothetical protein
MSVFFATQNKSQESLNFLSAKKADNVAFRELLDADLSAVGGGTGEVILGMPATPAPTVP